MLAEMDSHDTALVLLAVIAAFGSMLTPIIAALLAYFQYRMKLSVDSAAKDAAKKVEEVKQTLATETLRVAQSVSGEAAGIKEALAAADAAKIAKLDALTETVQKVTEDVAAVHKATNSLTDRLVESTGKEQFAAGKLAGDVERKAKEGQS